MMKTKLQKTQFENALGNVFGLVKSLASDGAIMCWIKLNGESWRVWGLPLLPLLNCSHHSMRSRDRSSMHPDLSTHGGHRKIGFTLERLMMITCFHWRNDNPRTGSRPANTRLGQVATRRFKSIEIQNRKK